MANVLIVYGSTTGNTENVAETIGKIMSENGHAVSVLDVAKASPANICNGRDCVLFGCSTWGDDSIELQDDFVPFFDAFDSIGAKGVNCASFGCGDTSYTYYCGAVDAINERLEELGANVIAAGLKIDGDPSAAKSDIDSWAGEVMAAL